LIAICSRNVRLSYGDDSRDEQTPFGHLRWLLDSNLAAVQQLQAALSEASSGALTAEGLLQRLQEFDARSLLHSEGVCARALAHAGVPQADAEAVSRRLFEERAPAGAPVQAPAPRGSASCPPKPVAAKAEGAARRQGFASQPGTPQAEGSGSPSTPEEPPAWEEGPSAEPLGREWVTLSSNPICPERSPGGGPGSPDAEEAEPESQAASPLKAANLCAAFAGERFLRTSNPLYGPESSAPDDG